MLSGASPCIEQYSSMTRAAGGSVCNDPSVASLMMRGQGRERCGLPRGSSQRTSMSSTKKPSGSSRGAWKRARLQSTAREDMRSTVRVAPQEMSEPKSGITRDSPAPIQDFSDTVGRHIELPYEFRSTHIQFLQPFGQIFSRVNRTDWYTRFSPSGRQQSPHSRGQALLPATQSRFSIGR